MGDRHAAQCGGPDRDRGASRGRRLDPRRIRGRRDTGRPPRRRRHDRRRPPAVFTKLAERSPVPTIDLTIHSHEAPPALPGWCLVRFRTRHLGGGFLDEDGEIWSEDGRCWRSPDSSVFSSRRRRTRRAPARVDGGERALEVADSAASPTVCTRSDEPSSAHASALSPGCTRVSTTDVRRARRRQQACRVRTAHPFRAGRAPDGSGLAAEAPTGDGRLVVDDDLAPTPHAQLGDAEAGNVSADDRHRCANGFDAIE